MKKQLMKAAAAFFSLALIWGGYFPKFGVCLFVFGEPEYPELP